MKKNPHLFLTALLAIGLLHLPLGATLLVYEGFSGYNEGALAGQNAGSNPNNIGLTGNWAQRGNISTNATDIGLTFGSLVTSGGAATVSLTSTSGTQANRLSVMGVEMNLASSVSGTLYSSMLFNFEDFGSGTSNLASMRVDNVPAINESVRLATYPLGQNVGTYNPGVSYDGGPTAAGQELFINTTYMAISVFENVGESLSGGNPGVASVYVLDEAQFENFVANGRSEGNLTGRATGSAADQVFAFATETITSGTYNFADANFLGLSSYQQGGEVIGTYDELRWGTDLDSITVIPEPGTLALMGLSLIALALFRRRR